MDTTHTDLRNPNFRNTGRRIFWKAGELRGSILYRPSSDAINWDAAAADSFAIGSRYECYSYILVSVTGRKVTEIPGTNLPGVRCAITFHAGDILDEIVREAWISVETWDACEVSRIKAEMV